MRRPSCTCIVLFSLDLTLSGAYPRCVILRARTPACSRCVGDVGIRDNNYTSRGAAACGVCHGSIIVANRSNQSVAKPLSVGEIL